MIQVETRGYDKDSLKIPIAVLKAGETRVLRPNLEFPCASLTFKLTQGAGPVYISGQHLYNMFEEEDYHDEDGAEEDFEDDGGDDDFDDDAPAPPQTNGKNKKK